MTLYLALEGPDGCGKSTQAGLLARWLEGRGHQVLHLREPGSTRLGEGLRTLLLDPATGSLSGLSEALLFSAARAELVREIIRPALAAGTIVVCERCYLSTWVYQGVAGDLAETPLPLLRELTGQVMGETWPDRVFVLDVSYEVGRQRMSGQVADRIEARGRDYHERVRAGYVRLAGEESRCDLVDASRAEEVVQGDLRARVEVLLGVSR